MRINLVGGTFQSAAINADAQRTVNLFPEPNESGMAVSPMSLLSRMGLKEFCLLPGENQVPQMFEQNGRCFAAGVSFWEVFSNGTFVNRGPLNPVQNGPIFMAANQNQILTASNGKLYLYDLTSNAVTPVNTAQFNGLIDWCGFSQGFFLAFQRNSQNFYVSALLDGSSWSGLDASQVEEFTDNIVSAITSHGEWWLMGFKASLPHLNSGALNAPFVPIPGAFVEQGSAGLAAVVEMDNTVLWMGHNKDGRLVAWRSVSYSPQRISNHGIENIWASYGTATDIVSFSLQDRGHLFWVIFFPSASATWVYDAATSMWHEWTFNNTVTGVQEAFLGQCHAFAFNKHLVGSRRDGKVYEMSADFYNDDGANIRFMRRAPQVSKEQVRVRHNQLQVYMETGLGPTPPLQGNEPPTRVALAAPLGVLWDVGVADNGSVTTVPSSNTSAGTLALQATDGSKWLFSVDDTGHLGTTALVDGFAYPTALQMVSASGTHRWTMQVTNIGQVITLDGGIVSRGPRMYLRWSDDGGHTWSNYHEVDCGKAGEYKKRAVWRRLGITRGRVYEVSFSDAIPWRLVDAYLEAA